MLIFPFLLEYQIQHVAIGGGGCGEDGGEIVARLDSLDRLYREQEQELHDLSEHTHKVQHISIGVNSPLASYHPQTRIITPLTHKYISCGLIFPYHILNEK